MTWRCRLDSSTSSNSTMPSVPTPAAARYSSAGLPRPPAPMTSTLAFFSRFCPVHADVGDDQVPAVAADLVDGQLGGRLDQRRQGHGDSWRSATCRRVLGATRATRVPVLADVPRSRRRGPRSAGSVEVRTTCGVAAWVGCEARATTEPPATTRRPPRGGRLPRPSAAPSCSTRPSRCSSPRATTPPRWTTSPSGPGVSKPVLYQHFPGKLDLYLALLDAACETIVDAVRDALDATEDNKQRVAATIEAFYDYVDERRGAFRLVFESDLTNEPAVRERVERVTTRVRRR